MRHNLFIQPEVFKFDFESDALETGFDEFESLDNEAMVGGIPEKDYLRWIQGSLNMYFKKTGLRPPLVADGKDTADFRNAVELFNAEAWGRSKNKQIDVKFQDALIKVNEANSGYLSWLRTQLNKLDYEYLTMAYGKNEKPTWAIKEFQRDYNGKFGFTLVNDGFVGAKTHLALLHATKRVKPKPESRDSLKCEAVKRAPVGKLAKSKAERDQLICLRDFLARKMCGAKIDDQYRQYSFVSHFGNEYRCDKKVNIQSLKRSKPLSAVKFFLKACTDFDDPDHIATCIKGVHDALLCYVEVVQRWAYEMTATGDAPLKDYTECGWILELQKVATRTRFESIYKCFKPLIDSAATQCV